MYLRRSAAILVASVVMLVLCSAAAPALGARTQLGSDPALSAYIGMQSTWKSLTAPNLARVTDERGADVAEYSLADQPTVANFYDHALVIPPLPASADWYAYSPTGDTFNLTVDIADTSHRLGKIVVTDLATGQVLGSVMASGGGAAITGQLALQWATADFRIDGYNSANALLFVLAASTGKPDAYAWFKVAGVFQPYRPAPITTPRFSGGCSTLGDLGDPYNPTGVKVASGVGTTQNQSLGCGAVDSLNDVSVSNPMNPPSAFLTFIKKRCIQGASAAGFVPNQPASVGNLATDIFSAMQDDTTRALTDLTTAPYSDNTGHWNVRFIGSVTSYFAVPYNVAKRDGLLDGLRSVFGTLSVTVSDNQDKLYLALMAKFTDWLSSTAGQQSGLVAGMVRPVGDVKTVAAQEDLKSTAYVAGITTPVTFTLAPDIPPTTGMGAGSIIEPTATTTPSPPPCQFDTALVFQPYSASVTRQLPKGYKFRSTGAISSPAGYTGSTTDFFFCPGTASRALPCTLTGLLDWNITTVVPPGTPPGLTTVTIKTAAGTLVASGNSVQQPNGSWMFPYHPVPALAPGNYRVTATRSVYSPPGTYEGVVDVAVTPAVLLQTTVNLVKK